MACGADNQESKNKHMSTSSTNKINISNEVGRLRRLLIHSPDRGIGKVIPSKAQDWLFEDIVHLDSMRRNEYDLYVQVLLWFLDPGKIKGRKSELDSDQARKFFKPGTAEYFDSDRVVDFESLLGQILKKEEVRLQLIAAICGIEKCSFSVIKEMQGLDPAELARVFISGTTAELQMLFAPLPNLLFTRDIGIVINDFVLLNKPAKNARTRESLLAQYIFFYHPFFERYRDHILEIPDNAHHFLLPDEVRTSEYRRSTLEGGDVMMVSPRHLLIGCSERTSLYAAQQTMKLLFEKNVVDTITVIKIPKKRDYMHIDTIFTQVRKDVWVLLESLARRGDEAKKKDLLHFLAPSQQDDEMKILQFFKGMESKPIEIENLEDLLADISKNELGVTGDVKFVYSGNGEFPFGEREQWTDSCNMLALRDGVVMGYDRNDRTLEAFKMAGFEVIKAADLLSKLERGEVSPDDLRDVLITLPSSELSRARGGPHCMSMPILRDQV